MEKFSKAFLLKVFKWLIPLAALFAFGAWMYIAPEGALGKLDAVGYAVCHRIDERSFHIDGRQTPLCARCTGEFFAAAVTLVFQAVIGGRRNKLPPRGILAVLAVFFLAFGIDGSNSYLYLMKQISQGALDAIPNLYTPNNVYRLLTGSGMGIVMGAMLYPIVNQTLWKEQDERPILGWSSFGALVALMLVFDLLILTEHPAVLYPAAYLSALGTLSLLTVIFAMLWVMIMGQDNSFKNPRELWLPLLAGLTLALLLILSIDLLRLQATGSWSGLPGLGGQP